VFLFCSFLVFHLSEKQDNNDFSTTPYGNAREAEIIHVAVREAASVGRIMVAL
jgi:hypothetical protein